MITPVGLTIYSHEVVLPVSCHILLHIKIIISYRSYSYMKDGPIKNTLKVIMVIRHTLQFTRSVNIQSYATVVWYSLLLTIKDSKVNDNSVHQLPKITFHIIALITSKSGSYMVASGYINTDWWLKNT